jgi:hypothetical protein
MLSVAITIPTMLSVPNNLIMLSVVMLNVVAPTGTFHLEAFLKKVLNSFDDANYETNGSKGTKPFSSNKLGCFEKSETK